MMCVSLHYQSKAFASWKHWKSTDVTPNCRISSISHIKLFTQFFDEQIYQVVNTCCRLHSFKNWKCKRLLLTLHYGNEMDIFCIAVNEKLFTTLHAPTPSLILVLTITQRCLVSQIRRDAVLSM
ncbi:hypothetical protein T03_2449 [Trichinella britovi]|uniref:Uncharacterized protein n=1 Tax=Trichinella britovi TaxID=45882 RepID=A0A0V1D2N7_TRIBR|nr:hypothetical protein T03_2449 [Trichinella britovi]